MVQTWQILDRVKDKIRKRRSIGLAALMMIIWLSGCRVERHEYYDHEPIYSTHFFSNQFVDGDISFTPPDTYQVTSALSTGSVLAGIDPFYPHEEFRGFLNFDFRDVHGVPWYALIDSATLEIFVNSVTESFPGADVPLILDLVSYPLPYLIADDFHRANLPPLMRMRTTIFPSDTGTMVVIDVTPLMVEAQSRGLPDLQLRWLLDGLADSGIVEIDDASAGTAPLLTVNYH